MRFVGILRTALRSLVTYKLRSALTMLGIIIGIASVITMLAIGNGVALSVQQSVLSLGSNLVTVTPQLGTTGTLRGAGEASASLTLADLDAIAEQLGPTIAAIEAEQGGGRWQVVAGAANWSAPVTGVTTGFPVVRDWRVATGEFFSETDLSLNAQVAVIGATTEANLFNGASAVGRSIQLRQSFSDPLGGGRARVLTFRVVGVLEAKGSIAGFSRDDQILVPLTTAQHVLTGNTTSVGTILVKALSSAAMSGTTQDVTSILLQRHRITDPTNADFVVTDQRDTLAAMSSVTETLTLLLGAIGGISLLVGGIGIMNIMLVSVRERTREIGIRKAVGARDEDILAQFLIESIAMTLVGGVLGIACGWEAAQLVNVLYPVITAVVTPGTVALAAGVSVAVGVVFGIYPAARGARLDPVEAMRAT